MSFFQKLNKLVIDCYIMPDDDDDVCFVLDQQAYLDLNGASSLKQVTPL